MRLLTYIFLISGISLFTSCNLGNALDLEVMSFDIGEKSAPDSMYSWQNRKNAVVQTIENRKIDVLGIQNASAHQCLDLMDLLKEYTITGAGSIDSISVGEICPILYNKSRFTVIDSGNFWLSETPHVVGSICWEANIPYIATWIILKDKETGREVFYINTHIRWYGEIARLKAVDVVKQKIVELSDQRPIVLMGEFGGDSRFNVVSRLLNTDENSPLELDLAEKIASTTTGTQWTHHDYGRIPYMDRRVTNHIFVNKGIKVHKYSVLEAKFEEVYLSESSPVVVKIEIDQDYK